MWQGDSNESSESENSDDEIIKAGREEEPSVESSDSGSEFDESAAQEDPPGSSADEEEPARSRSRSSTTSSGSSNDSSKKRRASKLDEKTIRLLEDNNYLRRSSRKPRKKIDSSAEEESDSSDSDLDLGRKKKNAQRNTKTKKQTENRYVKRAAVVSKKVNYIENKSDDDYNEEDVLEWEEEDTNPAETSTSNTETIEKIVKLRIGLAGATGSSTTCYNVAEKGDPNQMMEGCLKEEQALIKWVGWSHLHNTWESEASLTRMGAKGLKKLQNYLKKEAELELWRKSADKEYVEFFECEREMSEELFEQYKLVERIVAHQVSRDRTIDGSEAKEYLIKWCGLSYADCTWEDEHMIPQDKVAEYHNRVENMKPPMKSAPVLKRRPKFVKLEETPDFLLPPGREGFDLRDYQLQGLNWMLHAWCKGNSCILADEMGLGKTIQSISFLSTLYHRYELTGPFLVVVPLSTMAAWQKEFAQWAPSLNMVTYMGEGVARDKIRQFDWYMPGNKRMKINACLTTYEILLKDKPFLGSFQWAALLVDEAHRLKNDESLLYKSLSTFDTNHRMLITGTPLQNSLKELWALLHFIMPEKFNSWEEFEADHNDKDHKGISSLHRKLEPYLLRRVKKDVEKSLPPKTEQILRVDMTAQQKQYYKWILTKNYRELSKGVKGSINGFINLCMELKKCCNHSSLTRQYDYFENDPQARLQQLLKSSGKLILLDKLLCRLKDTGHRVLIFSQMVMMLDILQEYLQLRRFPTQRLDGSMRGDLRKQALDHFNAEGSTDFCFLLSTRAGGLGINLATADTVIIFDSDWNPQNDLQAMSRAHRIGQTKTVSIYRLVTKASVEEEIVERAKRKLVLDHLVIQRMDTSGRTVLSKTPATGSVPFDKSELNDILKFGAAELFQEKEGEEKEPEVDIDRILMGAETRDAEEAQEQGNDLLNSFKYANFVFDEEKDIAAAANHGSPSNPQTAEWDDIIPEADRKKIEDEEKRKIAAELDLLPRARKFVDADTNRGNDVSGSDGSSDEEDGGKKKRKNKSSWGEFNTAEIKRLVRSFKKFAKPQERLEAIAEDAELEDHSTAEMKRVVEAMLEGCVKAEKEFEKQKPTESEDKDKRDKAAAKGPVFKFGGVDVNVKQIRRTHYELEPLHDVLIDNLQAPLSAVRKAKGQNGWSIEWKAADDEAILRGAFKYGMGSWDAVKMDPKLGLADKIFSKEEGKRPQRSHVQARLEYLLKLMRKTSPKKPVKDMKDRKRKHSEEKKPAVEKKKTNNLLNYFQKKEKKDKPEISRSESKEKEGKRPFSDQLVSFHIDQSMYGETVSDTNSLPFKECVVAMKPVGKYLKKICATSDETEYNRCLLKMGNHCCDELEVLIKKNPNENLRKWYNYFWIFFTRFIPNSDAAELAEKYKRLAMVHSKHKKTEKEKHGKEHKNEGKEHKNNEKKDKHKDKKREKEKKDERKKEHHHRHHIQIPRLGSSSKPRDYVKPAFTLAPPPPMPNLARIVPAPSSVPPPPLS